MRGEAEFLKQQWWKCLAMASDSSEPWQGQVVRERESLPMAPTGESAAPDRLDEAWAASGLEGRHRTWQWRGHRFSRKEGRYGRSNQVDQEESADR